MTEPRVEAGDRALEAARKAWMLAMGFGDGVNLDYQLAKEEKVEIGEIAALIQSAMNTQERELRAKIKPMLDNLHTKPQPETGAWWRGECESNCHACTIERLLAELGGEMKDFHRFGRFAWGAVGVGILCLGILLLVVLQYPPNGKADFAPWCAHLAWTLMLLIFIGTGFSMLREAIRGREAGRESHRE